MSSTIPTNERFLGAIEIARLALRDSAPFIASLESHWQRTMQSSPADALGCSDEVWSWIALCYRPRDDRFIEDIASIAGDAGVDPAKLQNLLVTALAVERLQNAPPDAEQAHAGLLAARGKDNDEK